MTPTPAREAQEVLSRCEECGRQYWSDVEAEVGCIVGATPCPYCQRDFLAKALERHAFDLKEARETAERAHKMTTVAPRDWDREDALLFLNDVPWKRDKLTRWIVARHRGEDVPLVYPLSEEAVP